MLQISELLINRLTRRHIARLIKKLEQGFEGDVPFWLSQEVKKEFWLHNQNVKQELWNRGLIILDDKKKPWTPRGKADKNEEVSR